MDINAPLPSNSIASLPADELEAPPLTIWQLTWRRFRRHKMAMFGSVMLALLLLYAIGGAFLLSEAICKPDRDRHAPFIAICRASIRH